MLFNNLQSSDEEEDILDWDLPNLSKSDPDQTPYGSDSLTLSLQVLDTHYNHQSVLRLCHDYEGWQSAAEICELDKNYPLALLYRLKDRQQNGASEEEITSLMDRYIRSEI